MSLRKRIADSEAIQDWVARRIASYIRLTHRTTHWQRLGFEPLEELLAQGEPAIVVLWHQRLFMSPYLFPSNKGQICTITSTGRAGRMAGRFQSVMGMDTIAMSSHQRHVSLSRAVLGKIKNGSSIGIAADGPRGPERICAPVPIQWARTSGKRVFVVTFSCKHAAFANTWDRMMLPRPWSTGVYMCREWAETVPRKASADQIESLRLSLQGALDDLTAQADQMVGRAP